MGPFEQTNKTMSQFAWNLLSSIQVFGSLEKLNMENEREEMMYDMLLESHCKYLSNEIVH